MKKILIVLVLVLTLTACSIGIVDNEGWEIWRMNTISVDSLLVQSHDSFIVKDRIYKEGIFSDDKVVIKNPLNHSINVKITTQEKVEWIVIEAKSRYKIVIEKED